MLTPASFDLTWLCLRFLGAASLLGMITAGCRPAPAVSPSAPSVDSASAKTARARALLEAGLRAQGTLTGRGPISIQFHGTHEELGHFEHPRELREYAYAGTVTFDVPRQEIRVATSLKREDESYTSKQVVDPHRLYWLDYDETEPHAEGPTDVIRARYRLAELVPSSWITLALAESDLRSARTDVNGHAADVVSFTDGSGMPRAIYLDAATHLALKVERTESDDLFGDDVQATEYVDSRTVDGLVLPNRVLHKRLWYVEEELTCTSAPGEVEHVTMGPVKLAEPAAAPKATVERIGDGLFTIALPHLNNRTMFLELPEYVVAFEAPLTSANGELIISTIEAATHGKPIRYLAMSHYHPDYTGGLRPFVARGTHLVTTPGNVDYLAYLAQTPRTLDPDAQSRAPKAPVFDTVKGKRVLGEAPHTIEVYDIGRYTGHTDEYLVYYFPSEHLLFEGDLIGLRSGPVLEKAGKRATGLLQAVDDLHLDVERIVESWPLKDHVKTVPLTTLRQMVALRREQEHVSTPR